MKANELIDVVLRPHEVSISVTGPWGQETEVTVVLPDLRAAPRSVWGDWGPTYTVAVPPERPIQLKVRPLSGADATREVLDLGQLEVESPELAAIRETTPLFIELPLATRRMRLRIYYDRRGRAARAELVPMVAESSPRPLYALEVKAGRESAGGGRLPNGQEALHAAE